MKKSIAFMTALAMFLCLFSVCAVAQTKDESDVMQTAVALLVERIAAENELAVATIYVDSDGDNGQTEIVQPGDTDLDDTVTAADARLALRASVDLEELTDLQQLAADMDQDGEITAADARSILRKSVGLDDETQPDVPDEPDNPDVHTHAYVDYVCSCGEVQDGAVIDFLKNWIIDNHTIQQLSQYHVQIAVYNDDGETEYIATLAYDISADVVMVGSTFVSYDYMWTTLAQLTEDGTPGVGAIQVNDVETSEAVSVGTFFVDPATYIAGDPFELEEYDGYEDYRTYHEQYAGIGFSLGLELMQVYLTQDCGYIFDYEDVGFALFESGLY